MAMRDSLLYGHTDKGLRLPRLHADVILQNLLPFLAFTQPKGRAAMPDAKAQLKLTRETWDRMGVLSTITLQGLKRKLREEGGGTDDTILAKRAKRLWDHSGYYLKRDLYWINGEKKTQGDVFSLWARTMSLEQCRHYWQQSSPLKCGNEVKPLDQHYRNQELAILIQEKLDSRAWRRTATPERS